MAMESFKREFGCISFCTFRLFSPPKLCCKKSLLPISVFCPFLPLLVAYKLFLTDKFKSRSSTCDGDVTGSVESDDAVGQECTRWFRDRL